MAVNYEYYRCFYYVAKYKNLTRAANVIKLKFLPNTKKHPPRLI